MEKMIEVFVSSLLAVVGQNPENADYSNPNGDIIREVYQVQAEAASGARVTYHLVFGQDQARAERFAARVQAALNAGASLDPELWVEARPCYGSRAWELGDWDYLDACAERAAEEAWA